MEISIYSPNQSLQVAMANKNISRAKAIKEIKALEVLSKNFELRESEYLNNVITQNNRP